MRFFHGTDAQIAELSAPICLTADRDVALVYAAEAGDVLVYEIEVSDDVLLADEDALIAAADELGYGPSIDHGGQRWHSVYELADDADVQAALIARGFAGARYTDTTPAGVTHDTVQLWTPASVATVV